MARVEALVADEIQDLMMAFPVDEPLLDIARGVAGWAVDRLDEAATWVAMPREQAALLQPGEIRYYNVVTMLRRFDTEGQRGLHLAAAMRIATDDAPRLLTACVHQCRREGWSWANIGDVVGLTRQGAQQRWEERVGRRPSRTTVPNVVDLPPLR